MQGSFPCRLPIAGRCPVYCGGGRFRDERRGERVALRRGSEADVRAGLGAEAARVVRTVRGHRLALFLATLALSALCFQVIPGGSLEGSLAQTAVLAAVAVVAVALGRPEALALPATARSRAGRAAACRAKNGSRCAEPKTGDENACRGRMRGAFPLGAGGRGRWGGLGRWTVAVLALGALAGAASWWVLAGSGMPGGAALGAAEGVAAGAASGLAPVVSGDGGSVLALVFGLGSIAVLCLLTGVFEEGVFRVLALDALAPAFCADGRWDRSGERGSASERMPESAPYRRGLFGAAVASSVLFGMLHVSAVDAAAVGSAVAWAQFALKPVQAALFGFFMAALYVRTGSLWMVAGAHGLFNLLYTGPALLVGGVSSTYVTGSPAELALLAATTLLLIPPAIAAARAFQHGCEGAHTAPE